MAGITAAIVLMAAWIVGPGRRWQWTIPYLLCLFFFTTGVVHATIASRPPTDPSNLANLAKQRKEVSLIGTLTRCPEITAEQTTVIMNAQYIINDRHDTLPAQGLIMLTTPALPEGVAPGDLFIARATIGPVPSYGIPGVFNYQQHLEYQGIRAKGWIRTPGLIMKINRLSPQTWTTRLSYLPERLRFRLSNFLTTSLPPENAGIYKAILLGDASGLSAKAEKAFKASGSYHILSISGLHMALVALLSTGGIAWLLKRSEWALLHLPITKAAALLSLLPLGAYALIAGANPPVIRSLVMIVVFIAALLQDRQWSIPTNIAIAAAIILAVNPSQLFTASFQLTFAAVASIALLAPHVARFTQHDSMIVNDLSLPRQILKRVKGWIIASVLVSLAATLGTAPILAWQFNRISLASPISTLLIEPILCLWSLVLGLIACLFINVPPLAHALLDLGSPGINASLAIADQFTHFPWAYFAIATPSMPVIVIWYWGLFTLASWPNLSRRTILLSGLACAGYWITTIAIHDASSFHHTTLTVLDVGQGSAIIIETPNSDPLLVDGGKKQTYSGQEFDPGENLIAPYLWHKGIKRLSMIVCSHPDADHYSGIPFMMAQFKPEVLWINSHESAEKSYQKMIATAKGLGIRIQIPTPEIPIYQKGDMTLKAIAGGQGQATQHSGPVSANNQSLILRLTHGGVSFLMPSDIEKEVEQTLLSHPEIKADVLVAPHHGSATSNSEAFAKKVAPRYVAISAGQNQQGYFPAPTTVERYQRLNSTILNTAERGSLFFTSDGNNISVTTYR